MTTQEEAKLTALFGEVRQVAVNQEMRDYALAIAKYDLETSSDYQDLYHYNLLFNKTDAGMALGAMVTIAAIAWNGKVQLTTQHNEKIPVEIPIDMAQRALADSEQA